MTLKLESRDLDRAEHVYIMDANGNLQAHVYVVRFDEEHFDQITVFLCTPGEAQPTLYEPVDFFLSEQTDAEVIALLVYAEHIRLLGSKHAIETDT
jgi:hypothetical protein